MSTLVTADPHWSLNPINSYRDKFVDTLIDMLHKHHVSKLLILGDLTEAKDEHPAKLVNKVVEHLWRLSRVSPVIVLRGNHDYTDPNNPFFQFVGHLDKVSWINQPTKSQFTSQFTRDQICFYLPHTDNHERDWHNLQFDDVDWIFCHQTFKGAKGESGHALDGIPTEAFPEDVQVISGDIHTPQHFDVITYVGAPYTIKFGDTYVPRVLLLDKTKAISFRCPGPQKRLLDCESGKPLPPKPQINKGDIVKVRCAIHQFDPDKWAAFKASVYDWGERHGYLIHQVTPIFAREATIAKRQRHAVRSDKEVMRDYGKRRQISEAVMKTGYWLAEKA